MLRLALVFLVAALLPGIGGLSGVGGRAAGKWRLFFVLLLGVSVIFFAVGLLAGEVPFR